MQNTQTHPREEEEKPEEKKVETKERAEFCRPQKYGKDKYIICPRANKVFIINTTKDRVSIFVHYQNSKDWNEVLKYMIVLEPGTTYFPMCNPKFQLHIQRTEADWINGRLQCFDGMGYHKCEQKDDPCWIREKGMTLELVSASTSKYGLISLRHGDVAERNHRHIMCVARREVWTFTNPSTLEVDRRREVLTLAELSTIKVWENTNQDPVEDRLGHILKEVVPETLIKQLCPNITRLLVVHMCRGPLFNSNKTEQYDSCMCEVQETGEIWGNEHFPEEDENGTRPSECHVHGIAVKKIISLVFRSLILHDESTPMETPIMKRSSNPRPFIHRVETSSDSD